MTQEELIWCIREFAETYLNMFALCSGEKDAEHCEG